MRKLIVFVAVLVLMLAGCSHAKDKEKVSETAVGNETVDCQMPASYQSSLTNRLGAIVRVCFENDWTDRVSNGRAIADCSKEIKGISIDLENLDTEGNIVYQAHEISGTWLNEQANGTELVSDKSSINAVRVKLAGQCSDTYNVYTKVFQNNKWSEWTINGSTAGDENGAPVTGICIEIRKKTEGDPVFLIRDADTNQKMIALTFDDSPSDKEKGRSAQQLNELN